MAKRDQILGAIFLDPPPANIKWASIESLLRSLGAKITEGRGSRIRVELKGVKAVLHRPHPNPQAPRSQVRTVRQYLENAGVTPGSTPGATPESHHEPR